MKIAFIVLACGCFCMALAGCSPSPSSPVSQPDSQTTTAPVAETPTTHSPAVDVVTGDWDKVQEIVASHRGKVVVLDIWSTWCAPCIREFPHLVDLHNRYPDRAACVSLNINFTGAGDEKPEDYRDEVLNFLVEQNATFQNVLSSEPDEQLLSRIELDAVPAVYVYDRQGNLAQRFDNTTRPGEEFTYEGDVIPLVEQLLAEDDS